MKRIQLFHFKTLRMTIAIPVILVFLITAFTSTAFIFNGSNTAIQKVITQLSSTATQVVTQELDTLFRDAEVLTVQHQLLLERGIIVFGDNDATKKYLSATLHTRPNIVMTYLGFPDGQFYGARRMKDETIEVVRNNASTGGHSEYFSINHLGEPQEQTAVYENFDPRKRPWYKKAIETKKLGFTDMYSHFVLKEPTITASLPLYSSVDNQLISVFAVDFLTTWLTDTLKSLPIGANGHVIVVDDKQQLVSSTTGEALFNLVDNTSTNVKIEDSSHPITKGIYELSSDSNKNFMELNIDGNLYFISKSIYNHYGFNWSIYTAIAEKDHLQGMYSSLAFTYLIFMFMCIAFIYLTFRIAHFIVKPIVDLDLSAQALVNGSIVPVHYIHRKDELGTLMESFNIMSRRLTDQMGLLEAQVHARTMELEQKNQILKGLSETDPLTGISNRRRFIDFSNQVIELAARQHVPVAFIMMDIDYFKSYNDTYGHIAGDHVIEAIAEVLKHSFKRKSDIISRYGGEEFAAVLYDMTFDSALDLCQRLLEEIESLKIEHSGSIYHNVTISIGLYHDPIHPNQRLNDLIDLADKALYLAKTKGRNRVEANRGESQTW